MIRLALTAALALGLHSVSSSAYALTADELIAKNIAARGGQAALDGIRNVKASGTLTWGGGDFSLELATTNFMARPAKSRLEATFQGMTMVRAYDGTDSWMISPFQGRRDPQRNSADEAKMAKVASDLEGVLVNAKAKGYAIEYLGLEDVDGTMAHKLRVKLNATDSRTVFLDPDHFLEIRLEDRFQLRGAETVMRTELGDYEKVNGWYMPFYYEMSGQKISYEKIEANVELDEKVFAFPAAPAKP